MSIQFSFVNRGVVVTGGAQGIGLRISRDFLAAGARVSIWDYSEEALKKAEAELASVAKPGFMDFARVDVSDSASCRAAAARLPYKPDTLVNNAGITRDKSLAKMT